MRAVLRVLVGAAMAGLLSGCATEAKYKANLTSWVDRPEHDLIAAWGPPDSAYTDGDTKYPTYVRGGTMYMQGVAPTYQTTVVGNTAYTHTYGGSPAMAMAMSCKKTFTVSRGMVENWRIEGNHCISD